MKSKPKSKPVNSLQPTKPGLRIQTNLKAGIFECFKCLGEGKSLYECRSACK